MAVQIEAFDPGLHDTKDFRCGGVQTVEPRACQGFDAINAHAIGVADVHANAAPRAPRSNLIPGVFVSHLAVDRRHQGQGLGRILLVDAMQQCQRAGQILGVRLMLLDVAADTDESHRTHLQRSYASMGFRPMPGRPERLFISLSSLPPLQSGL